MKTKITYGFYGLVIVLLSVIAFELHGVINAVKDIDYVRIDDYRPIDVRIVNGK